MPIVKQKAPKESFDVFNQAIAKDGPDMSNSLKSEPVHSHRVFHASIEDIAAGRGLTNATPVAWQFHFPRGKKIASYEIQTPAEGYGNVHKYQEMSYGKQVDEVDDLLDKLENMQELAKENFELCILRLHALKINAVWLRASKRELDWFVPISPAFYGLEAGKLCNNERFLQIAQKVAQEVMARPSAAEDDMMGG